MKNFLLVLIMSIMLAPQALAQPTPKDGSVHDVSTDADGKTKIKHDSKLEATHDSDKEKTDKTEKIDKAEKSDKKNPELDQTSDNKDDQSQPATNLNDTSKDDKPASQDDANDQIQVNSDDDQSDVTQTEGNEKETVQTKTKHSKNGDSTEVSKSWESSLIKKQPTRKRQVTVEEIDDGGFSLSGEGKIVVVLLLTLIALAAINMFSKRLVALFMTGDENSEMRKRANTLSHMVGYFLVAITLALSIMLVMRELGLDIGPILAGAGVAGVALGFGAQSIVRDFISGFYIVWEDQIRVGDVIQIADKSGYVEALTLRLVTLRDESGNVHYIPCGEIKMVTNMTKNYSRYVLKLALPYTVNVDKVLEMVKSVDEELRADPDFGDDILEPIEIMGVDQFENNAIVLKARTKTKPIKQWRVGREFNRRLKRRLDESGIELPYSNISLYLGDKNKAEQGKSKESS